MPRHPRRCSALYSFSCLLDALDGVLARKFNQSTRFGAVLDMVTDRCTTTCLLVFLSTAKPAYSMVFQCLISLDLASHYTHMYATLVMGGSGLSHKDAPSSRNWLMNLYYTNKVPSQAEFLTDLCGKEWLTLSTGSSLHLLRTERAVLHRHLPALLL
jgi:CDP-diacylglycerol--inositol 3-phosphatidyltransferase